MRDTIMSKKKKREVYVLIPAAGSGSRMNQPVNKPFLTIEGVPVICRTVEAFNSHPDVSGIVIITSKSDLDKIRLITDRNKWSRLAGVTVGGETRQESVFKGLRYIETRLLAADRAEGAKITDPVILVHDAARCFISHAVIDRVIQGISDNQACGAAMPVTDTVKCVGKNRAITSTLERETLWRMQTPQGASFQLLAQAYSHASQKGFSGTDDLSVLEFHGVQTYITEGSEYNIKLTTPFDLLLAKLISDQKLED